MMRVVVDTNVLISAALKIDSAPRRVLRWVEVNGRLLKSNPTEDELFRTLAKPKIVKLIGSPEFAVHLKKIFAAAETIVINEVIRACRDRDDDKFLELASNGHADIIISGDKDLLVLDPFRGIPIVEPIVFLRETVIPSEISEFRGG